METKKSDSHFASKGEKMITEGYFARLDSYPKDEIHLCISWKYPWFVKKDKMCWEKNLSPSPFILENYKNGKWDWEKYVERFKRELRINHVKMSELARVALASAEGETIRLLCYEKGEDRKCHRFILLDILEALGAQTQSSSGSAKK